MSINLLTAIIVFFFVCLIIGLTTIGRHRNVKIETLFERKTVFIPPFGTVNFSDDGKMALILKDECGQPLYQLEEPYNLRTARPVTLE